MDGGISNMFCFHKWGKWIDYKAGKMYEHKNDTRPIYLYIIQKRVCLKCNKLKFRTVKTV